MEFDEDNQEIDLEVDEDIFGGVDDPTVQDIGSRKDAVLFLVDCHPAVFQKFGGKSETQLHQVLQAFQSFLKSKIISSVDDRVGLIFFNVKKDQNTLNFKGINLVQGLESPSAARIKDVLSLGIFYKLRKENNFQQDYGFGTPDAALYECLWLCNHEFKTLDKNKYSMRIFLFTPEDNPHFKDKNTKDQTIKHAKQLQDMDVMIELFPLYKVEGQPFLIAKFYIEIISIDIDELNNAVLDSSSKIMDLQQRIKQKEFKKRALNRLLLQIGEDVQVGLKVFCLINKAKKPIGKPVEKKTNSLLKKKAQIVCADSGCPIQANQIGTYFPLGNEKILIPKEQMNQIKTFEKPGMTLIGFKPQSTLKDFHNYRTSYFVYPDDEHVVGSSQFFHALIQQMSQKEKVAIVRIVPRQGSNVRFCAMIPQEEKYDSDHFQRPPGLHMVFLPYSDDIRGLDTIKSEPINCSRELINVTKILVNALTINDFDCANFEDPTLQHFFAGLQALALGDPQIDQPDDLLMPDSQGMEKYRDIIDFFNKSVDVECSDTRGGGARGGRGAARGGGRGAGRGAGSTKKDKKEDTSDEEEQPKNNGRGRGRGRGKQQNGDEDEPEPQPQKKGGRQTKK